MVQLFIAGKKYFSNNWELGQDASYIMTKYLYNKNDSHHEMIKLKPSVYGGYMTWKSII